MRFAHLPFSLLLIASLFSMSPLHAQDHTIPFSTTDAGVTAAITNWGLDTAWANFDNMQRGLIFMGTNKVNMIRVGAFMDAQLTNNDVSPSDKATMQTMGNLALMATAATRWDMLGGGPPNSWYVSGSGTVYPDRWALAMEACQRYYAATFGRGIWSAEPFNEPDYSPNGLSSGQQNLYDIFGYLRASTNFANTLMAGGSTLNDDVAGSWFNTIAPRAAIGSTHCLAGSGSSYVNFLQTVAASNATAFNPEVHNVMEVIMGANYGLKGAIWWGTAELTRGSFVNACQGQRLGYAEDQNNWTAAAVYRGTNGTIQAFLGGSERMATTTSYQLFAKDRDVFYNGYGPQRAFNVTVPGGTGYQVGQPDDEQMVNITWGSDVQPVISGRYIIANRNSHLVLEVPGASTNNGTLLDQSAYTGGSNQLWDVYPLPATFTGDISYYSIAAAHDGVTMDESGYSYNNGNTIQQWNGGTNGAEQWYFEYAGTNYFRIRSRWSGKCLGVSGASASSGAQIVQWDNDGGSDKLWRLIPAGASVQFTAPGWPTAITATANPISVQLGWGTNFEPAGATYTVLRSTNSAGPYAIVARGLTGTTFTDKSANQPVTYFYKMQATDRSMNVSGMSPAVNATPTDSPAIVAYYTFDGTFGDSSGNANDTIVTNNSPSFVAGKYGSALGLNGTNQNIMLPAGMLAGVTNFTIAAWVYWNGGAAWQRIFDFGNDTSQYLFLTPDSGSGTLRFAITTSGGGSEQVVQTAPLATNQWVHVAITCNGTTANLYTNGVLVATGGISLAPASFNPSLNFLGKSQYAGDPAFNGRIDEFLVANYAMTAAQVAWLPINSAPLPALVHRYSFSETSGSVVNDSIGGAAWNGTLPNGGTFGGGQLALNPASSQYVQFPAGILSNYPAVTIELWATFTNQIPWNTMLFAFGTTNGSSGENYIFCAPQSGRIAITSTNYLGEQNASGASDFSYHTNFHITAVFNPAADYLGLYTNGVLAAVNTTVADPMNVVSNVFSYLGKSLYSSDAYFNVSLDEFRIYSGAMQPADIAGSQIAGPNVLLTTNISLSITTTGSTLSMNWPVAGSGFTLASSPTLGTGAVWMPVSIAPSVVGSNYQFTVPRTNSTLFFRLQR